MPGFMRGPGEGPAYDFHGSQVVIKASGDDTLGQLSVMESSYPPGLSVHPHVDEGEDEMFYVLEGELAGFCGGDHWTAGAGSFVFVPRDRGTASPSPARGQPWPLSSLGRPGWTARSRREPPVRRGALCHEDRRPPAKRRCG